MNTKNIVLSICIGILICLPGCTWFGTGAHRETIFDRVVSIPKELVLDIPYLPPLCDEIPGLKKGFIDIPAGKLYYEEEGHGVPLVLLNPGPGGSHKHFHPYFSRLDDVARVIYYDTRGTGKSSIDETGKTYTIKQAVEDLEYLRKALKIDKWVVVGWSFGGALAQCYALTYSEHVIGLALINSGYGKTATKLKSGRGRMFISQAEREAIHNVYQAFAEGKLTEVQAGYNKDLAGDWKRQGYYKPSHNEMVRSAYFGFEPRLFQALMSSDKSKISLDGKFDDFEIPTLVTEAKWDLTWDTDKAKFMRKSHPHAQFELFKKSGHAIFADEPDKFFGILRAFLEKAAKTLVIYKPGNRLTWPKEPSELMLKIIAVSDLSNQEEKEKKILELYQQAVQENSKDASVWIWLAFENEFDKNYAEKALAALTKFEQFATSEELKSYGHCVMARRGELLDVLGRRAEAVTCYKEALRSFKEVCNYCSQVDRAWLEVHIKTPLHV